MKKFYFHTLFLLSTFSLLILTGCKTASKAYDKGDYAGAVELGMKKLQKDPYDGETFDLVKQSYSYLIQAGEDRIRQLNNMTDEGRYEQILLAYTEMNEMSGLIRSNPAIANRMKLNDYTSYVETYRDKTVENFVSRADRWAEDGSKQGYQQAWRELNKAVSYRPDDITLRQSRDRMYESAVTRVLVAPFQFGGNSYYSSSRLQSFQNDVVRTLSNNMSGNFVRFIGEWEARTTDVVPDQVLELALSRISYGRPEETRETREVSKQVVTKETVYSKDSVIREYATVKAIITKLKRVQRSEGDLYITVRDNRGLTLFNDRVNGDYQWSSETVTYTGDERALSDADKKSLTTTTVTPPAEEQIFDNVVQDIRSNLYSRLRSHYAQY